MKTVKQDRFDISLINRNEHRRKPSDVFYYNDTKPLGLCMEGNNWIPDYFVIELKNS